MVLQQFGSIKVLFLDVDGVLTDGSVHVTEQGEQLRRFSVKDGYAIQLAIKRGLRISVISGAKSRGVRERLLALGVEDIYLGVSDKLPLMEDLIQRYGVEAEEAAFMGDDMPDLSCMKQIGLALCPQDAVDEIKTIAHYVSPKKGGEGCVRDVLEKILKLQRKWGEGQENVRSA